MRVAIVHNLPRGGAHRVATEHLLRLGPDATEYCLASADPAAPGATVVPWAARAPEVSRARRLPRRYGDLASLVRAWRTLGRLVDAGGHDVVLYHGCMQLQACAAAIWATTPSVYFCHEPRRTDYEDGLASTRNATTRVPYYPLHRAERRLDRAAVHRCDELITNSRYTAGRIRAAYGATATPVTLGIRPAFVPDPGARADAHVLSVGTLIPSKGHEIVLRAVARLDRTLPVVLVAPRPDAAYQARLEALARELGVPLTIRVGITDDDLVALYQQAFATVQLGLAEPLGLGSLEAQACGSPVIVSDEGGLPETLGEDRSWAVLRDPDAVAVALRRLDDPAARAAASTAASHRGRDHGWSRGMAELGAALDRAANR